MTERVDTIAILSHSIEVLGQDTWRILGWATLFQLPHVLFALLNEAGAFTIAGSGASVPAVLVAFLPMLALTQLLTAVLSPTVARHLGVSQPPSSKPGLRSLAVLAAAAMVAVATVAGLALFLIPGWIVLTGLFVTMPALLLEERGPRRAMARSWQLMSPHWFSIFALVFFFTLSQGVVNFALGLLRAPTSLAALAMVPISALQAIAATVTYAALVGAVQLQSVREPSSMLQEP